MGFGPAGFGTDLSLALRQMRRGPLFSGVVMAVLALGIAINTGLLTTLHVYVWRPAPGIEPDPALTRITATAWRGTRSRAVDVLLSYPEIQALRESQALSDVAAWGVTRLAVDLGGGAEPVLVFSTTGNFFTALGVTMQKGTGFPQGVDVIADPVAVISHSLWMTHFNGSSAAIGSTVRIMNVPFTVIGVAPRHFAGVDVVQMGQPAVWIPLVARALVDPNAGARPGGSDPAFLKAVARLKPGIRAGDVGRLTAPVAARLARLEPDTRQGLTIKAERLSGMPQADRGWQELIAAVFIVAGLVLVITCANVSALLLGRAVARRREIGIRLALGASRLRIVRQLLTESLVQAAGGALLGLALYAVAMAIAYATVPEVVPGLGPKPATLVAAAGLALLTAFVFGLTPALHASRAGINEVIKNSGGQAIGRSRLQRAFVVLQLASSQPVLLVAGLVLVDLSMGLRAGAARAPASVVTMSADLMRRTTAAGDTPRARDSAAAVRLERLELIRRRVEQVPGVEIAALEAGAGTEWFEAPAGGAAAIGAEARQVAVTSGYFAARGIPLIQGRALGIQEDRGGSGAIVVSEALARRLWPGRDPLGQRLVRRIRNGEAEASTPFEVIGVAGRAPYDQPPGSLEVFLPLSSAGADVRPGITVRTTGRARPLVQAIRAAIREVEPYAALGDVRTLAEQYAEVRRTALLANGAAFAVGGAALLLASLGLYAVIAFAVAARVREIGVRLAVGASPGRVVRDFLRDGLRLAGLGLLIGVPVTIAGIRAVQATLVGFTPRMIGAVALVVPALIGVAALASCHMLWFLSIAAKQGYCVESYHDDAQGTLARGPSGKPCMTAVTLRPHVIFSGPKVPGADSVHAMHEQAHAECYIANSVTTRLTTVPTYDVMVADAR